VEVGIEDRVRVEDGVVAPGGHGDAVQLGAAEVGEVLAHVGEVARLDPDARLAEIPHRRLSDLLDVHDGAGVGVEGDLEAARISRLG
jgi:hypothetical protein